ncbi:acyltransferase [Desulfothermus naphthae]
MNPVEEWQGKKYNSKLIIGNSSVIMDGTQISVVNYIKIGDRVLIGRGCAIVDHLHDYRIIDCPLNIAPLTEGKPIVIEDDVFIGVNTVIAPGVRIGAHSFIGANSVVNVNIPPYSMVAGNPAKIVRSYNHNKGLWEKVNKNNSI